MPGSYLPPLTSALAVALLGLAPAIVYGQSPAIPRLPGSWWPRNSEEERRFLYSYPNVCRTLTAASEQIEKIRIGHPDSEPLTAYADGQRIIIRYLMAYRSLQAYAATHTTAQLNQSGRPFTNARTVRRLLRQTETFLRKNKVSEKEIDTIIQSPDTLKVPPATLTKIFYPAEAAL